MSKESISSLEIMKDIKLRMPTEFDGVFFTRWQQDLEGMLLLGDIRVLKAEDIIEDYLKDKWGRTKLISYNHDTIGFIRCQPDVINRNCSISAYIIPEYRDKGLIVVAMYKFINIMFDIDSYHKIEFSAYTYNRNSILNLKHFHFEGARREEKWYQDRYWDQFIFSLLRREWIDGGIKDKFKGRIERLNEYYVKKIKVKEDVEHE